MMARVARSLFRFTGLLVALAAVAFALLHVYYGAMIWWWRDHAPRETAFMAQRVAELRAKQPNAAARYFGGPAAQLTAEQAARLAAMAPNPRFYERNQGAPGLNRKIHIILARMPAAEVP